MSPDDQFNISIDKYHLNKLPLYGDKYPSVVKTVAPAHPTSVVLGADNPRDREFSASNVVDYQLIPLEGATLRLGKNVVGEIQCSAQWGSGGSYVTVFQANGAHVSYDFRPCVDRYGCQQDGPRDTDGNKMGNQKSTDICEEYLNSLKNDPGHAVILNLRIYPGDAKGSVMTVNL